MIEIAAPRDQGSMFYDFEAEWALLWTNFSGLALVVTYKSWDT
jgi:hypothetical protein